MELQSSIMMPERFAFQARFINTTRYIASAYVFIRRPVYNGVRRGDVSRPGVGSEMSPATVTNDGPR